MVKKPNRTNKEKLESLPEEEFRVMVVKWYGEGGGRREEGSGWGKCVYLWRIHVDTWQNQYNIVKLKNKIK